MRLSIAVCLALLGLCLPALATDSSWDFSYDEDVRTLIETKTFTLGPFFMTGKTSRSENALRRILKRDDYVRPLTYAYNKGTPATKAYVLMAFRSTAPSLFELCKKDIIGKYNPVILWPEGCLGTETTLLGLIAHIEVGYFDRYNELSLEN